MPEGLPPASAGSSVDSAMPEVWGVHRGQSWDPRKAIFSRGNLTPFVAAPVTAEICRSVQVLRFVMQNGDWPQTFLGSDHGTVH